MRSNCRIQVNFHLTAGRDSSTLTTGNKSPTLCRIGINPESFGTVRAPVGQLPQPANLVATGGDLEGTVDLSWDALRRGVQTYIAQQATSPSGPWTQCYVGKASSCTVTGLTSGTQYWFQVRAIGAAGPSAWSDPATKRAT